MPAFPFASCHQGLFYPVCQKDSRLQKQQTLQRAAGLSVLDAALRHGMQEPWLRSQLFPLHPVPCGTSSRPQSAPRVGGRSGISHLGRGRCWRQAGGLPHSASPSWSCGLQGSAGSPGVRVTTSLLPSSGRSHFCSLSGFSKPLESSSENFWSK